MAQGAPAGPLTTDSITARDIIAKCMHTISYVQRLQQTQSQPMKAFELLTG